MSTDSLPNVSKIASPKPSRLFALDALRGLIIVFMALDHANHFIAQKHSTGEYWGGSFPVYQDVIPFLTRFITHFSAPGFFLLMGIGMALFAQSRRNQGWSQRTIIRHFVIRGAVLIALQLLVVNRAWELSLKGWGLDTYIGVLFALGGTMILGSFLLSLKPIPLFALSGALLLATELLVPDAGAWGSFTVAGWIDYLNPILIYPGGNATLWANYPVLPWLELTVFGIAFGTLISKDPSPAFKRGLILGAAFLAAFVAVRVLDGFGNIRPRMGDTGMDFLNPVKYPPSITFTLMTTGLNLTLLYLFSRAKEKVQVVLQPLIVFGQAPLFFYVLHLFLYAGLGIWLTPKGTSILAMYPYWLLGLLVLFLPTKWYGQFKRRQPSNSLLRFL